MRHWSETMAEGQMMKDSIGIDVSKDHPDVHCLGDGRAARFGNDAPGLRKFKAWLPKADGIARVVCEGEGTAITGPATRPLTGALAANCRWSGACPGEGGGQPVAGAPVCPIDRGAGQDRRAGRTDGGGTGPGSTGQNVGNSA